MVRKQKMESVAIFFHSHGTVFTTSCSIANCSNFWFVQKSQKPLLLLVYYFPSHDYNYYFTTMIQSSIRDIMDISWSHESRE